eukprot:3552730-Rhodomonas_salina.1
MPKGESPSVRCPRVVHGTEPGQTGNGRGAEASGAVIRVLVRSSIRVTRCANTSLPTSTTLSSELLKRCGRRCDSGLEVHDCTSTFPSA